MIPLWTVPLLLAGLLAAIGWAVEARRRRKMPPHYRSSWNVPDGVTGQDVAALYWRAPHPMTRASEAMQDIARAMRNVGPSVTEAEAAMRLFSETVRDAE